MPRTPTNSRIPATRRILVRDMGTSLRFNGATTDVTITSQLFYQNTGFTVSLWTKAQLNGSGQRLLTLASSASNNQTWLLQNATSSGQKIGLFIRNDANAENLGTTNSVKNVFNGEWHHIVVTDNNGTCKLYIDGIEDTQIFNYTRSGVFTFNRTGIGALVRGVNSSWFNGYIDDVRIWNNTVLTAAQVSNLYLLGLNPSVPTSSYNFDEGSGTTATDSGSLATNGTITNATYSSDVALNSRIAP